MTRQSYSEAGAPRRLFLSVLLTDNFQYGKIYLVVGEYLANLSQENMQEILNQMNIWWQKKPVETKIRREKYLSILQKNLANQEIILLLGSRRVGKTTIMKQWIDFLLREQQVSEKNILYALLDHPELKNYSLSEIIRTFRQYNDLKQGESIYVFFDEIQYRSGWDQEIKALYETEKIKFVLSGSAISLLSRQKNFLTGRFLKYIVQPLDFSEYQKFVPGAKITDYLINGGYPEFVLRQDPQYLLDLTDNIVYKDIVEVYQIRNPKIIKDLLLILSRATGFKISLNKISKTLGISIETVKDYLHYLAEVYLVYELPKYTNSLNERIYNEKKYYFYDTGLCRVLSGENNFGSLAENAVANHLKNEQADMGYFYHDKKECDFVVKKFATDGEVELNLLEVKFDPQENITNEFAWQQKGLHGFYAAAKMLNTKQGLIITNSYFGEHEGWKAVPLEKWLKGEDVIRGLAE